MLIDEFKEFADLVRFCILVARLHRKWSREFGMDILPVAACGPRKLEAERPKQPLELSK